MKSLGLIVVIPLLAGLLATSTPTALPSTALPSTASASTASASTASASTVVAPSPEGGSLFICVATGLLFGAAVLAGNALAAAGAVVSAIHNGCI